MAPDLENAPDVVHDGAKGIRSMFTRLHTTADNSAHRKGYPQYSFMIAETPEFQNFRRFRRVRARLLLMKQDQISQFEEELDRIDQNEEAELFLGNCRRDQNASRKDLLSRLHDALKDYDVALQRSDWALNTPSPSEKSLMVMKDWSDTEGLIARAESHYLNMNRCELLNVGNRQHLTSTGVEHRIEHSLENFLHLKYKLFSKNQTEEIGPITIYKPMVRGIARFTVAILAIFLLLAPIIGLNAVEKTVPKFVIICVASSTFVASISVLSNASIGEVFTAGATYAAVMVVFVSGNGIQSSSAGEA